MLNWPWNTLWRPRLWKTETQRVRACFKGPALRLPTLIRLPRTWLPIIIILRKCRVVCHQITTRPLRSITTWIVAVWGVAPWLTLPQQQHQPESIRMQEARRPQSEALQVAITTLTTQVAQTWTSRVCSRGVTTKFITRRIRVSAACPTAQIIRDLRLRGPKIRPMAL